LDNLPEDKYERFNLLGIETFALDDGDNDLAQMMEMSAIEERRKNQEIEKAAREEKKKQAAIEKERLEKEAAKKALKEVDSPVEMIKIEVCCG